GFICWALAAMVGWLAVLSQGRPRRALPRAGVQPASTPSGEPDRRTRLGPPSWLKVGLAGLTEKRGRPSQKLSVFCPGHVVGCMPGRGGAVGLGSSHVIPSEQQEHAAMGVPEFTVDVFNNEYLPAGEGEVNAIVTVTCADSADAGPAAAPGAAEI